MTSWTGAHQVPLPMGFSRQETLKLVATFFSGGSYKRRDQTNVSYTGRRILYHWSTWEAEIYIHFRYISDQFSWVAQSCLTLCDPTDGSTIGHPVHHQLPELTQTQVCWFGDVIQPSHPLWSPSPPALNLSQHQGLLKWVSSLHQVVKILEFQIQHQSFQWAPRTDLL